MLRQLGYNAEGERHVLEALVRIEAAPNYFHLVVTDQTMPGLTGLEFTARIRALRPDLPVVLTTGNLTAFTKEQTKRAGVREVFPKPYTMDDLAAVVHRQLAH